MRNTNKSLVCRTLVSSRGLSCIRNKFSVYYSASHLYYQCSLIFTQNELPFSGRTPKGYMLDLSYPLSTSKRDRPQNNSNINVYKSLYLNISLFKTTSILVFCLNVITLLYLHTALYFLLSNPSCSSVFHSSQLFSLSPGMPSPPFPGFISTGTLF